MLINKQANYGNLEAFLFPTELTVLEAVANFSCETTLNNMLSTLRILPSKGTSVILLSLINFVPYSLSLLFAATKVIFGVENIVNFFFLGSIVQNCICVHVHWPEHLLLLETSPPPQKSF